MSNTKSSRNTTTNKKKTSSSFGREITFVIVVLFCVLMMLSYFDLCGIVGSGISYICFGLLGTLTYLFPILLLVATGFRLANPDNKVVKSKIIYGSFMFITAISFVEWVLNREPSSVFKYYTEAAESHLGGGLIGGLICHLLKLLLGRVGSVIVLVTLFILLFIFMSRKMLFTSLREAFEVEQDEPKEPTPINNPLRKEPKEKNFQTFTFETDETVENKNKKNSMKKENEDPFVSLEEAKPKKGRKTKKRWSTEEANNSEIVENKTGSKAKDVVASAAEEKPAEPGISIIRPEPPITTAPPVYKEEMKEKFGAKDEAVKEEAPKKKEKVEPLSQKETDALHKEMDEASKMTKEDYKYPSLDLLNLPKHGGRVTTDEELIETATKLQETLQSFGVLVKMGDVSCGPSVTRFELIPEQGVKVSRITSLADDIKLSLAASDIRIEAPIPGKAAVGIEVPNTYKSMVTIRELLESKEFGKSESKVSFAVGKDIAGKTIVSDIAKMPHLLVAGATGSGKSVCVNTLIMSILYKAHPDDVKLILIDPKQVEFQPYNDIPHLMIPVVIDPKKASAALTWAVAEMTKRYEKFVEIGVKDMKGYNKRIENMTEKDDENYPHMPQIVIIVDEFADLMMVAPGEVEDAVCRLAQLARAAGIHLVLATQRPSVNVITGLIKANIPSRIALSVSSAIDSRTIIDTGGAEKLLGNGDMLFAPADLPKPIRIQGAYVSEKEVENVVNFLKGQFETPSYNNDVTAQIDAAKVGGAGAVAAGGADRDDLFVEAGRFIIEKDKASIGMLQRVFRIGFNRAARIMDQLADAGVVGPEEGTKPRTILMSEEQFENFLEEEG